MRNLLKMSMEQWKLSLMSNGEDLGEVNVKRDISRDCLSPILFVLSMVPVTKIPIVYVSLYVDIYFACRYYFHSQKIPTIYVFCM